MLSRGTWSKTFVPGSILWSVKLIKKDIDDFVMLPCNQSNRNVKEQHHRASIYWQSDQSALNRRMGVWKVVLAKSGQHGLTKRLASTWELGLEGLKLPWLTKSREKPEDQSPPKLKPEGLRVVVRRKQTQEDQPVPRRTQGTTFEDTSTVCQCFKEAHSPEKIFRFREKSVW